MKAIQVVKPGEIRIIEYEMPKSIGSRQVLVRTKAAGICHSDILIYNGGSPLAVYPRVIGHEAVGEVARVGSEVDSLKAGDRVVLEPIEYCGQCYACRVGRPNVCQNLKVRGVNTDGGFQEYFTAYEDKLHKFPDTIEWEKAVMIEPFTIGAQIVQRGGIREGDLVLIYGAGPAGLAALENAKIAGAVCILADISDKKLEFAKEAGADYVCNSRKTDLKKEIEQISDGMMCNVVVDAVGLPSLIEEALSLASVAGRVVCLGFTDTFAKVSLCSLTKKELTLLGSRLQTHQFEKCVKLFSEREIHLTKLITHVFHYEEIGEVLRFIESHPDEVGKVILRFD